MIADQLNLHVTFNDSIFARAFDVEQYKYTYSRVSQY